VIGITVDKLFLAAMGKQNVLLYILLVIAET